MDKLTENSIKKAQIQEKQYKIYDGNGMFLLVHPNGSKYWRMKYTFDGKSKLASFGVWPDVSLKEARVRRYEAREKIRIGINPVEKKRKNKRIKIVQTNEKPHTEAVKGSESVSVSPRLFRLFSPQGEVMETDLLLRLLRSIVYGKAGMKPLSGFDKDDIIEIFGNIYRNRRDLFQVFWKIYLSIPVLNIVVLFVLLLLLMDFFPALFTTILYFILTVCSSIAYGLWEETKVKN